MGDHHHHSHLPHGAEVRPDESGRLIASIGLNLLITVAEVVGGLLSGSLSLLSDAVHNLSDTASLGISYAARRISKREATPEKTFGYKRAEIIGAFINLITLMIIALFLVNEAIHRFLDPRSIDGVLMLTIAVVGLFANVVTALLLYRGSRGSLNLRSAFLHILTDGLSSVGVVVGGLLIIYFDLYVVDPIITLGISLYLMVHAYGMLRVTIDILMEGTPAQVEISEIVEEVRTIERVIDIHHVHVWQLDDDHLALEAHVVISNEDLQEMEAIKTTIKQRLLDAYQISHSTLELETVPCDPSKEPHCYERVAPSEAALAHDR
ncbi:MAG: cation diffusion facilitator family transporter [Rhodothermales bacterium]